MQCAGGLVVEARLPRIGAVKSATYTGDGYITVRHSETEVVEEALKLIGETVRIGYSQQEAAAPSSRSLRDQWSQQIQYFDKQLYRPAWEEDSRPVPGDA
jgi:hypothetical protein